MNDSAFQKHSCFRPFYLTAIYLRAMVVVVFIVALQVFPFSRVHASEVNHCGQYEVNGTVRILNNKLILSVSEGTKSELHLSFRTLDEIKVAAYIGYPVSAVLNLEQKFDGTDGKVSKIVDGPSIRVPDPLRDVNAAGLELKKKTSCQKAEVQ